MKPLRLLLAIVAAFLTICATDFLIHQFWLGSTYALNVGTLWRAEAEMKTHFHGLFIGQLIVAVAFAMIWARIALGGAGIQCALALGFLLGAFYSGGAVIQWAVQPLPEGLLTKWIIAGIGQNLLVGLVVFLVYPPSKKCPQM